MACSQETHPADSRVFQPKMPLFDRAGSSSALATPVNMSSYLGKQLLPYNGVYYVFDPQGKDRVPLISSWSDSKTLVPDDGRAVTHRSGMETERGAFYRQDGDTSPEGASNRSLSPRAPVRPGFQVYAKSPAAAAPAITSEHQRAAAGRETPSPRSEQQRYLAVPRPVYAHSRCCDDAACARGRYSVENGFPGMSARQAHWVQTDPRCGETSAFQKKPPDTLLQRGALHFEPSGGRLQRIAAEYGPDGAAPPYSAVPNYKSYPSSLFRTHFDSPSDQREQKSLRGFPYVYPSPYTYEHKNSGVYQEHSPMAKYGHVAQRPVFYCAQPDVEVEKRTQPQDNGSRTRDDVPVVLQRTVHCPKERYGSPHLLHGDAPFAFACADASANPAFMQALGLNYYAIPRFHSGADQHSAALQKPDAASDCANDDSSGFCIDYSKFSVTNICSDSTLHDDPLRPSTPEPTVPTRRPSESDVSPRTQNNRHCDPNRYRDYSSCEASVSAGTRPTYLPRDASHETRSVIQSGLNARKIIYSPPVSAAHSRHATHPLTSSRLKVAPKRSRSCSDSPIIIKQEREERLELPPKMKKVQTEMVKLRTESPPMPVISDVFSLAPYNANLQVYEDSLVDKVPLKPVKSDHCGSRGERDCSEERTSRNKEQLVGQKKPVEGILEAKQIKVEEDLPNQDGCEETSACREACNNVAVKREADESGCDCSHTLGLKKGDAGSCGKPSTFEDPKQTPDMPVPVKIRAQTDSPPVERTSTQHQQPVMPQPRPSTPPPPPPPPPPSQTKVDFKNIPLHCLKLTTYRFLLPGMMSFSPAPPPEKQKSFSPTPPSGNQKLLSPPAPPENQRLFRSGRPPEYQKSFSPAAPPVNQKLLSPAAPPENQRLFRSGRPPVNQKLFSPAAPPVSQKLFSPAAPPVNKKLLSPAPPPENQKSFSPAPPPENQKSFSPAPPPENQEILSSAAPPENQELLSSAAAPEHQKSFSSALPPENQEVLRPDRPSKILKPSSSAGPLDSTNPEAESLPEPGPQRPVRKHFLELHFSLQKLINKSVFASSEEALRTWLSQLDLSEAPPPNAKLQGLSCLLGATARSLWFNEEIRLALQDLLQRLKEYIAQDRCPFPHVIRAGAVFLPMLVIKKQLFPMVQSNYIDQVLQEHRIELRPATLSEEKILIQLHKGASSSRLRKLMSLKHLPDVYADVANVLYYCCVTKYLGLDGDDCVVKEEPLEESISAVTVVDDLIVSPATPVGSLSPGPATNRKAMQNRTKSRIKSSSRRMFLDEGLSDEEKVEIEGGGGGGGGSLYQKATRCCESGRTKAKGEDCTGADKIPSLSPPISTLDNSWMCPLTFEDLPPSPGVPAVPDPKCTGVVLKLRRMFCCKRKKARYQAVPDCAASHANASDDSQGARKWHRTGCFLHATTRAAPPPPPRRGSSQRKRSSFLKVKCCPYLSAERRRHLALQQQADARLRYPDLVGKKIRHLYEEDDKSEVWYRGEVLRVHEAHSNPLKTIFEVCYDSEPEWRYFLELLIDYKKGWLKIEQ